jgi:hypothetical protein
MVLLTTTLRPIRILYDNARITDGEINFKVKIERSSPIRLPAEVVLVPERNNDLTPFMKVAILSASNSRSKVHRRIYEYFNLESAGLLAVSKCGERQMGQGQAFAVRPAVINDEILRLAPGHQPSGESLTDGDLV